MSRVIHDVLSNHTKHWKIDRKFMKQVKAFKDGWVRKGDHVEFLISGTIGTQDVVFSITDDQHLMHEVFKVNHMKIKRDIKDISHIKEGGAVLANPKYHVLIHLIRMIHASKLSDSDKNEFILDVYSIFFFMKVSSKLTHDFSAGAANPDVALATFESLSNQFIVKRLGSWNNVIEYIAHDFYARRYHRRYINGIYYDRCQGTSDKDVTEIIMGCSTKLSGYLVNIYGEYIKILEQGMSGSTTSNIVDFGDDGVEFQDFVDMGKHNTFLKEVIILKSDFVKSELVEVIVNLNGGVRSNDLTSILHYFSDSYLEDKRIADVLEIPVTEAIRYINENHMDIVDLTDNLETTLEMIRGKWLAGKGQTEAIYKFKDIVSKISRDVTGKKTHHFLTNVTIMTALYIFLRAIVADRLDS